MISKYEYNFGLRLKRCRNQKKMTQNDLALRSGVLQQHISRYERGIIIPNLSTLCKLADALGISPAEFFKD